MNAYRCDGCGSYLDGDPRFTILRDEGYEVTGERYLFHACTWTCVGTLARDRAAR